MTDSYPRYSHRCLAKVRAASEPTSRGAASLAVLRCRMWRFPSPAEAPSSPETPHRAALHWELECWPP